MLSGKYATILVLMSILVAIASSYTALSLSSRVARSSESSAKWWIGGGALAMGTGIWSMHFVGMLAFNLPIRIAYDLPLTLLSWVIPVIVSALSLWQVSRSSMTFSHLAGSATLMGIGIVSMHYVGMAAMRIEPGIIYDKFLVALSVIIAILAAASSLWIAISLRRSRPGNALFRALGSIAMGFGIAGMHYTGLASANFPQGSICLAAASGINLDTIATTVIIATLAVLTIALVTTTYDTRLASRTKVLSLVQEVANERQVSLERERNAREESEKARVAAESARSEAERINTVKDEFLATLSHELRTPLNSILGWVQLMQIRKDNNPAISEGLAVIERNARAQGQLIEDLLDMSGIAGGRTRLETVVLEPCTLINGAIDTSLPAAGRKNVTITRALDDCTGTILADPSRLEQVVSNLLSNAIKFTPEGGRVHVHLTHEGNVLVLGITDSGIGIPSEFLPHAFDLFRQADSSTTRRHGGLGIGLSIVRQLVELHGGTVAAESQGEGTGATFVVKLPLYNPSTASSLKRKNEPAQAPQRLATVSLAGRKILVVEDEADSLQLIKNMLIECGATVTTAADARSAVTSFVEDRPDLLVSDIGMPGMDGIELIRHIRSIKHEDANIPAIALSAYARGQDRELALTAGFSRYLNKPVDGVLLTTTIQSLLEARG